MTKKEKQKLDKFHNKALDEMFRLVGFEGYDKKFAQQDHWFTKREWSLEDDVNFTKWFTDEYAKEFRVSKSMAKEVAAIFVFNYGWKIRKEHDFYKDFRR